MQRWQTWTAVGGHGAGSRIDPGGVIASELTQLPHKTDIMQKDNLGTNGCVVALQQQKITAEAVARGVGDDDGAKFATSLLDLKCCGHSCVLCIKPVFKHLDLDTHVWPDWATYWSQEEVLSCSRKRSQKERNDDSNIHLPLPCLCKPLHGHVLRNKY